MSDTSKKARRDQAREHARELREKERRRRSRNSLLIKLVVGLTLVAVAAGAIFVIVQVRQAEAEAALPKPGPANMLSDGIILVGDPEGSGEITAVPTPAIAAGEEPVPTDPEDYQDVVRIVMYVDYFCPICKTFEQTNIEQLGTWVAATAATLEIHPIAILDNASMGTRYASRAANAMACVAEYSPDMFFQATTAMYGNQPAEGTVGLTDDQIVAVLGTVGVTDPKIATCIEEETFKQWVAAATARTNGPIPNSELTKVSGTPTVLVNGIIYPGDVDDAEQFKNFVTAVATGALEEDGE